jgi:hypothetical protein
MTAREWDEAGMTEQAETATFYLLACRACEENSGVTDPKEWLIMPFGSAEERGKWAAAHSLGTGHDNWWVHDQTEGETRD